MKVLKLNSPLLKKEMWSRSPEIASALGITIGTLSRKVNNHLPSTLQDVSQLAYSLGKSPRSLLVEVDEVEEVEEG